jgi:magnesium chelatase subunit D
LYLAHQIIQQQSMVYPDVEPLMILLTDGAGNVSLGPYSAQDEAHRLAERIAEDEIRSVVINMEHAAFDQGLAQSLANHLEAPCYTLGELKAETLYQAVKDEMI